jgi:hypothetical protein
MRGQQVLSEPQGWFELIQAGMCRVPTIRIIDGEPVMTVFSNVINVPT